jgi:hypothetical protein
MHSFVIRLNDSIARIKSSEGQNDCLTDFRAYAEDGDNQETGNESLWLFAVYYQCMFAENTRAVEKAQPLSMTIRK